MIWLVGDASIFGASEYLIHTLTGTEHISVPSSIPGRHQSVFVSNSILHYLQSIQIHLNVKL